MREQTKHLVQLAFTNNRLWLLLNEHWFYIDAHVCSFTEYPDVKDKKT